MKNLLLKLFLFLALISLPSIGATNSYFSDAKTISLGTISTGNWTDTPVTTRITTNYNSATDAYSSATTDTQFTINYSLNPASQLNSEPVALCYSYNLSPFDCDNVGTFTGGSLTFNFPEGPGLYLFETKGVGETKVLDPDLPSILTRYLSVNYIVRNLTPESFNSISLEPFGIGGGQYDTFVIDSDTAPVTDQKEFSYQLNYNLSSHQIELHLYNLPQSFIDSPTEILTYEIVYYSGLQEQGIAGQVLKDKITNFNYSSSFYLGTCSQSVCIPHTVDENKFSLILSGTLNNQPITPITSEYQF